MNHGTDTCVKSESSGQLLDALKDYKVNVDYLERLVCRLELTVDALLGPLPSEAGSELKSKQGGFFVADMRECSYNFGQLLARMELALNRK